VNALPVSRHLLNCERQALGALVLIAAASLPVSAQAKLDHWTTEHGLPQNYINAITQTRDGYLWLATNEGLARFDGLRFTVFKRSTTAGLATNRFMCLYEDRHGTLWAGSPESVLTRYRDGDFHSFTRQDGLPADEIGKIEEDETGRLWLTGVLNGYIVEWDARPVNVFQARNRLPGLYRTKKGHDLHWSLSAAGLHLLRCGQLLTLTLQDGLPSLEINNVSENSQGIVCIYTRNSTVHLRAGRLSNGLWQPQEPPPERPLAHFADRHGNYWYGEHSQLIRTGFGSRTVHDNLSALAFWEDREGSLWIGASDGLYRHRPLPVRTLTEAPGPNVGVTNLIYTVLEDRQGDIWLGKWGGGLSRYRAGQFIHYVTGPEWQAEVMHQRRRGARDIRNFVYEPGLYSAKITAMYEDRTGLLWAGTQGGVSQLKDGQWTCFSAEHGLIETWAILQDRTGAYWFVTHTGLVRWQDNQWTVFTTQDGLPGNECHALLNWNTQHWYREN
jgi:ligand-binding sensor domain-containing protein